MKLFIVGLIVSSLSVLFAEETRLIELEPDQAAQIINQQDQSLSYAPKIESNVPGVRFIDNHTEHVVEDIYLANQYHGQDGLGAYVYGYKVPDIAKTEKKERSGDLKGSYNYIAGDGQEIKVEYWDDGTGFHQIDNVPKIQPKQVEDSPEVKAAKEEHLRIWQEQAERNSHPIADPYANSQYAQPQPIQSQYQQYQGPQPYSSQNQGVTHYQAQQGAQVSPNSVEYSGQYSSNQQAYAKSPGAAASGAGAGFGASANQNSATQQAFAKSSGYGAGAGIGAASGAGAGFGASANQNSATQQAFAKSSGYGAGAGIGAGSGAGAGFGAGVGAGAGIGAGASQHSATQQAFAKSSGYGAGAGIGAGSGAGAGFGAGVGAGAGIGASASQHSATQQAFAKSSGYGAGAGIGASGSQHSATQQAWAEGSGKQDQQEQEEENGPPKGFFYSFDYPVGLIVGREGKNLEAYYSQNKNLFEKQLSGEAPRPSGSSNAYHASA